MVNRNTHTLRITIINIFVVSDFSVVLNVGDTSVSEGSSITIEGSATGGPSIETYQWRRNGMIISGENGSQLTITDMSASDIGEYEHTIISSENISYSAVINIGLTCKSFSLKISISFYLSSEPN